MTAKYVVQYNFEVDKNVCEITLKLKTEERLTNTRTWSRDSITMETFNCHFDPVMAIKIIDNICSEGIASLPNDQISSQGSNKYQLCRLRLGFDPIRD